MRISSQSAVYEVCFQQSLHFTTFPDDLVGKFLTIIEEISIRSKLKFPSPISIIIEVLNRIFSWVTKTFFPSQSSHPSIISILCQLFFHVFFLIQAFLPHYFYFRFFLFFHYEIMNYYEKTSRREITITKRASGTAVTLKSGRGIASGHQENSSVRIMIQRLLNENSGSGLRLLSIARRSRGKPQLQILNFSEKS